MIHQFLVRIIALGLWVAPANSIDESINPDFSDYMHTSTGHSLYIDDATQVAIKTKRHGTRQFTIEMENAADFRYINEALYDNSCEEHTPNANHLFVSLMVGYKQQGDRDLKWRSFCLNWDTKRCQFSFEPFGDWGKTLLLSDFYNLVNIHDYSKFKGEKAPLNDIPIIYNYCPSKLLHRDYAKETNCCHSEPGALSILDSGVEVAAILESLPWGSKIKVIQLGLHSYLDFCQGCEEAVSRFQENFKRNLISHIKKYPLKRVSLGSYSKNKIGNFYFLVTGMNNKIYSHNIYYNNKPDNLYSSDIVLSKTPSHRFPVILFSNN